MINIWGYVGIPCHHLTAKRAAWWVQKPSQAACSQAMTSASSRICAVWIRMAGFFQDMQRFQEWDMHQSHPISVKVNSCRDLTKYDFEKYITVGFDSHLWRAMTYMVPRTYIWLLCINSSDLWHIMAWSTTKYSPPHLLLSHHSLAGTENM